jgi:predicted cobalt transporter CbtA
MVVQTILHYSLHLLAPGLIAWVFFRDEWKKAWLIMLATMLVDLDHLLATPIFDPHRCSIGFHPLHSYYAIAAYPILLFFSKTRVVGVGLLFHMLTDFIDCQMHALTQ